MRKLTKEDRRRDRRLGACVKDMRQANGITIMQLAHRMGCSNGFLVDLEKGYRHWSSHWIHQLEKALKV